MGFLAKIFGAVPRDGSLRLWDVQAQREIAAFSHDGEVFGVSFSPDGTRLASACRDNTIRLWDIAAREEVAKLLGHQDGRRFVGSSLRRPNCFSVKSLGRIFFLLIRKCRRT
jgi:WD40 repeat protein